MGTVSTGNEPQLDRDALAALYEETFRNLEEGTITEGRVVALTKDKVVVDIGYNSEGMIAGDQFSSEELQNLKVGDRVVTTGGLYGSITKLNGQSVSLQVAPNVRLEVARTAIVGLQGQAPVADSTNV